ncbi:MAG TPA: YHYH protein [Bacteroidia bacterium]|nr:YHYH protein [Bacteroidia bacterium]
MKKGLLLFCLAWVATAAQAQLSPAITAWLRNTTITGSYYASGNSTPIPNNILVNCQQVEYSATSVYVSTKGVPSYPTGPFLDGNPSNATNQNAIFRIPLAPVQNTGNPTATTGGNIGVFINGVALFDYRDGVAWNTNTGALCGGPGNPPCQGQTYWNRDAVPAEKPGFDCSKGHPAMGNYHHHQNPSAFKLDLTVISTICNLYDADGLYAIDSTAHSPLIGYAYDGFPIYGAYGYQNANGTGGIVRIKSGYQLRNISVRTHWADGTDVPDGPAVNGTYTLGYFREDYEFVTHTGQEDYLDEHNGRFCVTPEYPNGTYAYFATVDANWNSAYPYVVGPTFYGTYANRKVTSITEPTTVYTGAVAITEADFNGLNVSVYPNPASDLVAIQIGGLVTENLNVELIDMTGRQVQSTVVKAGQTIAYFDVQAVYDGIYLVKVSNGEFSLTKKIVVAGR